MRMLSFMGLAAVIAAIGCGSNVVTGTGGSGGGSGGDGTGGSNGGSGGTSGTSPCPVAEPSSGKVPCTTPNFACTYGDSVRPECRDEFLCTGGVWSQTGNFCPEPPPNACGTAEPKAGTVCNGLDGSVCTFGDDICLCSSCSAGPCSATAIWSCAKPPAGCPDVVPNAGTPCNQPSADCTYGFPCGASGTHVTCTSGLWKWDAAVACPL